MKQEEESGVAPRRNLKALLCQVSPIYKNKIATIERIAVSLNKYSQDDHIDLVVFPEMSFTGYNFANPAEALPLSVQQDSGLDFEFARSIARRLQAYVAFGYIEAVEHQTNQFVLYNSAGVIDR